jgi:hypothetical protein
MSFTGRSHQGPFGLCLVLRAGAGGRSGPGADGRDHDRHVVRVAGPVAPVRPGFYGTGWKAERTLVMREKPLENSLILPTMYPAA